MNNTAILTKAIKAIISLAGMNPKYTDTMITSDTVRKIYERTVFTHPTFNPLDNYEFYEFTGDLLVNKALGNYVIKKFPQLNTPVAVGVLSNIHNKLKSTPILGKLAMELNFPRFLKHRASNLNIATVSEDMFEAFFGATEQLANHVIGDGMGGILCEKILFKIFDERVNISLDYYDIYPPKSILYEFESADKANRKLLFTRSNADNKKKQTTIQVTIDGRTYTTGTGIGYKKADADEEASRQTLMYLENTLNHKIRKFDTLEGLTRRQVVEIFR